MEKLHKRDKEKRERASSAVIIINEELERRLEDELTCEAERHLWKEDADPKNGSSDLTCQHCGNYQHLQWP